MESSNGNIYKAFEVAFAIIPKVGGALSMIASCLILRDIMKKWLIIPLTTEIMTNITVANLFIAFWECFLSTWMVPRDSPGAFMATGNTATCTAQGFIAVVMFLILEISYTILSVLYWILVTYGWTDQKMRTRRIRFIFLWLPAILSFGFGIPLLFFNMYNFSGGYSCMVEEYPLNCDIEPGAVCTRGANARGVQTGMFTFIMICTGAILSFMVLLVRSVKKQESKSDRYLTKGQEKQREMTNKTFWQATRYFLVFFVSNTPFYIFAIYGIILDYPPVPVAFIYVTVWPLFGVFNSFAFFRPRYLSYRDKNPDKTIIQCLLHILDIDLGSWFSKSDECVTPPNVSDLLYDEDLASPLFNDDNSYCSGQNL